MSKHVKHVVSKLHKKPTRLHIVMEAVGNVFVAYETGHLLISIFFVAWAALDAHEIFWGGLEV